MSDPSYLQLIYTEDAGLPLHPESPCICKPRIANRDQKLVVAFALTPVTENGFTHPRFFCDSDKKKKNKKKYPY